MRRAVTTDHIIKLAAMECGASCILTALNIAGLNYRYFLLSYWNLTYFAKSLLSGKPIIHLHPQYPYGIEKDCRQGSEDDLIALLQDRHMVLVPVFASKLRFFPKNMLGHEANGFQHFVMVYGYEAATGLFQIIDPVADFIGDISISELKEASGRSEGLVYHTLIFPKSSELPPAKEIFQRESNFLAEKYTGEKAIDHFSQDLSECLLWSEEKRNVWIDLNNITITSIIKTRTLVWNSYCELGFMSTEDIQKGNEWIEDIVKHWLTVNFLLLKLKKSNVSDTLIASMNQKLAALKTKERAILEFIKQKGGEISAV